MKSSGETFPWRVKIKPIKIFDKPIKFKPLIPKLKFITNKKKWSGHLMGKEISLRFYKELEDISEKAKANRRGRKNNSLWNGFAEK